MGFNKYTALKKREAIELRLRGMSYGQILKKLDINSKGTLSNWFKNLKLSPTVQKRLENNIKLATERGLFIFNKERTRRIVMENKKARVEGQKQIKVLTKRELMLVGASLYWGEGTKSENRKANGIAFANSNPDMIILFMKFIRDVFGVEEKRIRAGIHLYPGMNVEKIKKYWSDITYIPIEKLHVVKTVSRSSKGIRKWNRLPHGTIVIVVNGRQLYHQIMGMIDGLIETT